MRYDETIASKCRYGDVAQRIFGEDEIIWEDSEEGYTGSASLLVKRQDGSFAHYEWSYGSCSGCDDWEMRELTDDQIEAEMRAQTAWLSNGAAVKRYATDEMLTAFLAWVEARLLG